MRADHIAVNRPGTGVNTTGNYGQSKPLQMSCGCGHRALDGVLGSHLVPGPDRTPCDIR